MSENQQPEALRLAEQLEVRGFLGTTATQAATELRRLNALNTELLEVLKQIDKLPGISSANLYARTAIAKATTTN